MNAAFAGFVVQIIAFVKKGSGGAQHTKAMSKTAGYKQLGGIVFGELLHHMLPKRGTVGPKVHGHIEHPTFEYSYQFGLRLIALLKMQPPDYAVAAFALIVLHKSALPPGKCCKLLLVKAFKKIASTIVENGVFDDEAAFKPGFDEVHIFSRESLVDSRESMVR